MPWGVKTIPEQVEELEQLIIELRGKIDTTYKSVQDMSVDYYKTENAIRYIKQLNTEIKRLKTKKRRLINQ